MKTLFLIAMSAVVCQTALAQDLSSFYYITGFRLPALHPGQYSLSLSPHYSSQPGDNASMYSLSSSSSTSTSQGSANNTQSIFGFNTNFTYGVSDVTTIALGLQYNPYQTAENSKYNSTYTASPSFSSISNGVDQFQIEGITSSVILSHRIQPNMEFSIEAQWGSSQQPSSGTLSQSDNNTGATTASSGWRSSSNNYHYIYVAATIVILHY